MKAPSKEALTKADVLRLISELARSDASKTECGKRLIKLYEKFT